MLKKGEQRYVAPVRMLPVDKSAPWSLGSKTFVMGIVNVTPDSFSDGAELESTAAAVEKALEMERAGVDIIDIGGESSRPGAEPVTEQEELRRVLPVIRRIREKSKIAISIDTTKAKVARQAVDAGANVVNDISAGLNDDAMLGTVAMLRVPVSSYRRLGNSTHTIACLDLLVAYTCFFTDCADAHARHTKNYDWSQGSAPKQNNGSKRSYY